MSTIEDIKRTFSEFKESAGWIVLYSITLIIMFGPIFFINPLHGLIGIPISLIWFFIIMRMHMNAQKGKPKKPYIEPDI